MPEDFFQRISPLIAFPSPGDNSEIGKLLWLVKLRWLALGLFFLMAGPALQWGYLNARTVLIYLGLLGVLLVFNLLTQLVWSEKGRKISNTFICFQLAFDLFILATLLFLTGGLSNPFIALFFLNASLGGILIHGRLSWPFVVLMHTLLLALQLSYVLTETNVFTTQTPAVLGIFHILLFSFWFVMRSLGHYLERQSQQRMNNQLWVEKKDRLRALGSLAAGFSHEFASPLQAAKLRLERLERKTQSPELSEAIGALERCEQVLRQMNSSQMDTRDYQQKPLKLVELLNDIVDSWQEENPQVEIEKNFTDVGLQDMSALNFAQVVLNLLDNAAEASEGKPLKISLAEQNSVLSLTVQDQGPGFASEVTQRWGEPFITTKPEGTGLGLYVSQLFAQSLGGELKIRNMAPHGAEVVIFWPAQGSLT